MSDLTDSLMRDLDAANERIDKLETELGDTTMMVARLYDLLNGVALGLKGGPGFSELPQLAAKTLSELEATRPKDTQ